MRLSRPSRLATRLFLGVGLSTLIPLTLIMALVLFQAYQLSADQNQEVLRQMSRRYAAQVEGRLDEKMGWLSALATLAPQLPEGVIPTELLRSVPGVRQAWVRRDNTHPTNETYFQQKLYGEVRTRAIPVLSTPDFSRAEASMGVPLFDHGRFSGMVALSFSLDELTSLLQSLTILDTGYAFLVDSTGDRITHPNPQMIGQPVGRDLRPEAQTELRDRLRIGLEFAIEKPSLISGKWSRLVFTPIDGGRSWDPWYLVVVSPSDEINRTLNSLFLLLFLALSVSLVLVGITAWAVTRSLIDPLRALTDSVEALAEGRREARVAVVSGHDEVGGLARAFNRMADELVLALQDRELAVEERTASLRKSLQDLESAQAALIDNEKMALLGQLTATIAHEINTPLAAIRSSATFLAQMTTSHLGPFIDEVLTWDGPSVQFFHTLVTLGQTRDNLISGKDDRKLRKDLSRMFFDSGIPDPETLAEDLVGLAGPSALDFVSDINQGRHSVVRRAAEVLSIFRSSGVVLEASDRAAQTVRALVNYSREQNLQMEPCVDLAKELSTLVTLYYGIAKAGVEILTDFEAELTVPGDRDKLNQVWVNLINNALQAMHQKGRLRFRTHGLTNAVEISIANDGPEIPTVLRDRIFQPFFTTKPAGEGTGLGLDICRRIVEAHHGSLTHSQENEWTVFTVRLPRTGAE